MKPTCRSSAHLAPPGDDAMAPAGAPNPSGENSVASAPRRAWPALTTMSQTQGTRHDRTLRLPLVWWRRAAEDPWRGSPLLFRYMPTPLACDLP
jgi:hypothetical protein